MATQVDGAELVVVVGQVARAGEVVVACVADEQRGEGDDDEEEGESGHGRKSAPMDLLPPVAVMTVMIDFLPEVKQDVAMHKEAVVVQHGAEPFGLGAM